MRCKLCDAEDNTISWDPVKKDFTDCQECQSVIQEALDDFAEEEDEDESKPELDHAKGRPKSRLHGSGVQP